MHAHAHFTGAGLGHGHLVEHDVIVRPVAVNPQGLHAVALVEPPAEAAASRARIDS